MNLKNISKRLNLSVIEEEELIISLPLGKYFLMFIPIYFVFFAVFYCVATLFYEFDFNLKSLIIQAVLFTFSMRIFYCLQKKIQQQFKNRHN